MKKIGFYIGTILVLVFLIPIIFTRFKSIPVGVENPIYEVPLDYSAKTIKLLHKKNKKVEEVNLEDYIAHVVSAEMPANYNLEALKAQAIVARTYTIYKMTTSKKHKEADICDDSTCCQAWISKEDRFKRWKKEKAQENWNKIIQAVNETKGEIITYQGKPINAFFHANSGGKTEIPFYVWGGNGYPYLQVVETAGEENYSGYQSEVVFTKKEFESKIKKSHKDFKINYQEKDCIQIKERDSSDRVITVKIGNLKLSGVETRTLLGLKSSNFKVTMEKNKIKFQVIGYGHGVGMSQTGADSLAKQGKTDKEIIEHFYKEVEIKQID